MHAIVRAGIAAGLAGLCVVVLPASAGAQESSAERELAAKRAEREYLMAKTARVDAEIAAAEFELREAPNFLEIAKYQQAEAVKALGESQKRLDEATRDKAPAERIGNAQLNVRRATIAISEADTKRQVLENYSLATIRSHLRKKLLEAQLHEAKRQSEFEQLMKAALKP